MNRGRPREFDQQAALERARNLFWQHGYRGCGLTALLKEMKIGRQSLYDAFGDKRSLFLAALTSYTNEQVADLSNLLESAESPLEGLRQAFLGGEPHASAEGETMCSEGQQAPGCMLVNTAAELGAEDPDLAQVVVGHLKRVEALFGKAFEQARTQGDLPRDADPEHLASTLHTLLQGLAVQRRLHGQQEAGREVLAGFFDRLTVKM